MAEREQTDDRATPHVKRAIRIESKIWLVIGTIAIVLVIIAAVR